MKNVGDYNFPDGEILLVNKPLQWSSFDVVKKLRRFVGAKIGHAGTLDPLATGLMLIGTGSFTKKLTGLTDLTKEYTGTIFLGATTPSFDRETPADSVSDISGVTETAIQEAAVGLTGKILQVPPAYSAIKIDGKRSYKLARKGKARELQPRELEIAAFEITGIELPLVHFRVECSKGTYIRALADDFGKLLGVGGYLYELCRTRVGTYRLEDAWEVDELARQLTDLHKSQRIDENIQGH
jgi:tRNA pseudouridine55 synthase